MADERQQLLHQLQTLLGPAGLLHDAAARRVYSMDSSHLSLGRPWAVALPETSDQVAKVVGLCAKALVPVVCRGSGTGLSGGAVPCEGALVLGTARMNNAGEVFGSDRSINVQVGIINDQVTTLAAPYDLHFAPDPSSQAAATIGGNIAENAGGPHCLRYGVTLQHLRRLQWVDAQGGSWSTGRGLPVERGLDLASLLCGSEGTLGVVTEADLNLVPNAESVVTLLAFFPDLNAATTSVVSLLKAGLQPVAVEMVDQAMLVAVEQAFSFGFPTDIEGAMIVEFTGSVQEVAEDVQRAESILTDGGAREVQQATTESDRLELWKCRKKAFGAVGRLAPHYVTMDVVVPLGRLPELVRRIQEIKTRHGVDIATAFHAGDGNLHPGVHFDDRIAGETEKAHRAADEIIRTALDMDGSSTGEHGVGLEKLHVLHWQLSSETVRLSRGIKNIFDPNGLLNPGKMFPDQDVEFAPCKALPTEPHFRWDSMSVTAPAQTLLADIQAQALEHGLCLPVGTHRTSDDGSLGLGASTTIGDLVAQLVPGPSFLAMGTARDFLLELWARTGDGHLFHTGAPVFKNVAGYGLHQSLCGSGRHFAEPLAATFQLKPVCEAVLAINLKFDPENAKAEANLESLLTRLPVDGVSSPAVVLDRDTGRLLILVGGRNRSWSLESLSTLVTEVLPEFELLDSMTMDPKKLGDFLNSSTLPGWSKSSVDWTMWSRPPGNHTQRLPAFGACWIWQGIPGLCWTPDSNLKTDTNHGPWCSDHFFSNGLITPAPEPAPHIPGQLLVALKNLFDPEGQLENITNPDSSGVGP